MVEDRVASVQFDGPAKLSMRVLVIFQFVIDHALGVVDGREGGVHLDELIEAPHGLDVLLLPVVAQAQVVEAVHVGRVYLQGGKIVLLLLSGMAQFLVAVCAVIVGLEIPWISINIRGFSSIALE